jgi:hypothetical protein
VCVCIYLCTVCLYLSLGNAALLDQAVILLLSKRPAGGIRKVGIRDGRTGEGEIGAGGFERIDLF